MTDYTDLIARLRFFDTQVANSCADALEAQAQRIAELRKEADMMHSEYKTARARIAELEAALDSVLIGGNHLALLIGADHPLHTASHEEAMAHYGSRDIYEIWCCWRTMMNAGPVLAARAAYLGEKDESSI